jgi:hypothetical protein
MTLPFISMNSGFLDGFLEDFHSTFALPYYGKKLRPKNEFAYTIETQGHPWFTSQSGGIHLTDSRISLKLSLFGGHEMDPASLSLLYTLKLPTGNAHHGFGSGHWDHGLFLLYRYQSKSFDIYANPCWINLSKPDIDYRDIGIHTAVYGLLLGCDYVYSRHWTFTGQLNYYTSPLAENSIPHIGDNTLQLAIGASYELASGVDLELTFIEDLSETAPDFTVYTRIGFGLNL